MDVRVGHRTILGEHGRNDVDNDIQLRLVSRSDVDEDVLCVQRDLAVLRVDDGRHGQNSILRVVDDGIYWRITDDMEVTREMFFCL